MNELIITQELLETIGACEEAKIFITENNLWQQPESVVVESILNAGHTQYHNWWLQQKNTEKFIRYTGKELVMGAFKVFDPLTGEHSSFDDEESAKACLIEISKNILKKHCPIVVRSLRNEYGDETWIPTDIHERIEII